MYSSRSGEPGNKAIPLAQVNNQVRGRLGTRLVRVNGVEGCNELGTPSTSCKMGLPEMF